MRVSSVLAPGVFSGLVSGLGAQGLDLDGTAILNNRQPGDAIPRGELIKTVLPARLR